jgi:pectate lyase
MVPVVPNGFSTLLAGVLGLGLLACSGSEGAKTEPRDAAVGGQSGGGTSTTGAAGNSGVGGGASSASKASSATGGASTGGVSSSGTISTALGGQSTGGGGTSAGGAGGSAAGGSTGGTSGSSTTPLGGNVRDGGLGDAGGKGGTSATATGGQGGTGTTGGSATGGTSATSSTATGTCTVPPEPGPLLGWASQPGSGNGGTSIPTTTGGGDATPVTVTTLEALNNAAKGTTPAVIYVKGVLAAGTVKIGSNKTIAGICGAEIHGHVGMSGAVNVIIRNIKVVGYNCSDSPGECKGGDDAISVVDSAHHIWFDHCDISDGSDGNLDITQGSDFVTVSWTKFSYSTKRTDPVSGESGHRFSNLIGADDGVAIDKGHLNVTWHHNWWAANIDQRMPRSRDGKIHVVNNLFTASGNSYCSNSGNLSSLLVENNIYIGVNNPLQEDDDGNMLSRGNVFTNTTGSKTSKGTGFTPPYTLKPDETVNLETTLRAQVGPQRS